MRTWTVHELANAADVSILVCLRIKWDAQVKFARLEWESQGQDHATGQAHARTCFRRSTYTSDLRKRIQRIVARPNNGPDFIHANL